MMLSAAACGQKEGVADQAAGLTGLPAGAVIDPETGAIIDPETGEIIDPETGEVIDSGTTDGTTTTDGDEVANNDDDGDSPSGSDAPSGGNATGVTASSIKIGIHAPITGAAPVPSQSFQKGKDLYWNYLKSKNLTINGRNVEVVFRNDNYNPSQAVTACREMVEDEKVFLLVGVAGTDQIQACAKYAASVGVPYVSAGVTEIGLETLPNYFAIWLTYAQQGPLLADLLVDQLGAAGEKNGFVWFNTPTFRDGHDSFVSAMGKKGANVDYDKPVAKTAGASEAQAIATELNQRQIDNVHILTSPTFFIQLAQAAVNQGYRPQWVGYGLTKGIDTVANVACRNSQSINNARFLSPFPAYYDSNKFDSNFRSAGGTDDIMFGLWGMSKVVGEMLKAPGKDLSRERFVHYNRNAKTYKTGVNPDVAFNGGTLGGTSMHLLRADCSNNRYVTEASFKTDF
jgi:ABC-type branched-subunit amino acid transport system substrate-binding protein